MSVGGAGRGSTGAVILDGRRCRDEVVAGLREQLQRTGGPQVTMATVVVGDDPAELRFAKYKHVAAEQAGMRAVGVNLAPDASQADLEEALAGLCADPAVHGVFLQLPLPAGLDVAAAAERIDPAKDIDAMTVANLGRLAAGRPGPVPCATLAILRLLERYKIPTAGRRVVVVGQASGVAVPLALLLSRGSAAAAVTLAQPGLPDLPILCREADILVADAARPGLVTAEWVGDGATVVDVGVSRVGGVLVGDVAPDVRDVAGAVVPNPGGVGPTTVACLLEATVAAARAAGVLGPTPGGPTSGGPTPGGPAAGVVSPPS